MTDELEHKKELQKQAKQAVERFEWRFGEPHLLLAYHAALPLVLTPELVNYLRNLTENKGFCLCSGDFRSPGARCEFTYLHTLSEIQTDLQKANLNLHRVNRNYNKMNAL